MNIHLTLLVVYSVGVVALGLWTARLVRTSGDFFVATWAERIVLMASGGMSHFPGTDRYASPDLEWDRLVLAIAKQQPHRLGDDGPARSLLAAAMIALLLRRRVGAVYTGGQVVSDLCCAAFLLGWAVPADRALAAQPPRRRRDRGRHAGRAPGARSAGGARDPLEHAGHRDAEGARGVSDRLRDPPRRRSPPR